MCDAAAKPQTLYFPYKALSAHRMPIRADYNECDSYAVVIMHERNKDPRDPFVDTCILLVSGGFTPTMLATYVRSLCRRGPTVLENGWGTCKFWTGSVTRVIFTSILFC